MPLPFTLPELEKAMNTQVENLGGFAAAIAACDRMYSAMFRGDAVKLSDCEDWEDCINSLYLEMSVALYSKSTGEHAPVHQARGWAYTESDDEEEIDEDEYDRMCDGFGYEMEYYEDKAVDWMNKNHPDFKVDGDTLVVDFCNYKGEGEDGLGLYLLNKHLNVFKSKSHSFNQVN